ncbi:MAG: sensor histidine kinase [Cyanophyceae cyanobacterium]
MTQALSSPTIQAKLSEEQIQKLAECGTEIVLEPGDLLFGEGDSTYDFHVILEGAIRLTKKVNDEEMVLGIKGERGDFIGELSLLTGGETLAAGRAVRRSRLLRFDVEHFKEILNRCPQLRDLLIPVMAERTKEIERQMRQQDKLAALGKLSAGLAHELNNPAAAGRRAAKQLRTAIDALQSHMLSLRGKQFAAPEREMLKDLYQQAIAQLTSSSSLSPLEQSDREDELADWLEEQGVANSWDMAPTFVAAGLTPAHLDPLAQQMEAEAFAEAMVWLEGSLNLNGLINEIEQSTGRISELVCAIKSYSYMDRAPLQEIDIREGLESTLTILHHKLKHGVAVHREYDPDLPRISAHGGELNQVWTNLLDNAIDAMEGKGEITIRTALENDCILVEIEDNGPGIPKAVQPRIFDPFFTTKRVGGGSGLGLDIVRRIVVKRHSGNIRVDSEPGRTCFQVRLPIAQS